MWLLWAILSGSFYTVSNLVIRHVLKQQKDAWAFSFFFSACGAAVSLPFLLVNGRIPGLSALWLIIFFVGFLIVGHNWLNFRSNNYLDASLIGTISKFRLVWVFVLSLLFLGEHFSWLKLAGTVLTVLAGWTVVCKFRKVESLKGIVYSFSATLVYAIVIIISKFLLTNFNPSSLTFFIFFIPAVLNLIIMPRALSRIKALAESDGKGVFLACVCGGFANLTINQAFAVGEVSRVVVVVEAFLIATLVGEHIIFKEKAHLLAKIVAVVLAILGVILIEMS